MKKIIVSFLALIVVITVFFAVSKPATSENQDSKQSDAFAAIESDMSQGSPLIDVRTPEEFKNSHIKGAVNMPLDEIKLSAKPQVSLDATVYVYCRSGNRSAEAKSILENAGFTQVIDLGAMSDVIALGASQVQ